MARSSRTNYQGITRSQEVKIKSRRVDTRGFWDYVYDNANTPGGTLINFGVILLVCAIGVWVPFVPELCFLTAIFVLFRYYRYKNRFWSAPFRVPAYLKYQTERQYIDETTGKPGSGDVYMGYCLETKREVWASLDDVRTHRLTVGTTGSGKTEEFLAEIFNALIHDSGVMFVDGKGEKKGSLAGTLKLARLFWRDEDVYQLNYVMGGEDAQLFRNEKRSNTFNPLQNMGSSAMTEIVITLLSDTGADSQWKDFAIALIQGLIPPLNYLSKKGYLLLNAKTFSEFLPIEKARDLCFHQAFIDHDDREVKLNDIAPDDARFLRDEYLGALRIYFENLPGWSSAFVPKRPFSWKSPQKGDVEISDKTLEQHGYRVMQVVKPIVDLSFVYGHIYNVPVGEIDFKDVAQNRRILVSLLPALERSTSNMQPLGKMTVAAVKNVLAGGLAGPVSGSWRQVMSSQEVARGPVPFFMLCDEYGYYVVEGFAVAPAQARSLGYSITFGVQDIDSLMKSNQNEGAATIENTNIAMVGRMTGGKDSTTFQVATGRAGEAYVQEVEELTHEITAMGASRLGVDRSRMMVRSRLDYQDMAAQKDGDFHMIIGTPVFTRKGVEQEVRVVRMKCFYTGTVPQPDAARPLDLAFVTPLSVMDKGKIAAEVKLQKLFQSGNDIGMAAARLMERKTAGSHLKASIDDEGRGAVQEIMEYLASMLRRKDRSFKSLSEEAAVSLMLGYYSLVAGVQKAKVYEHCRSLVKKMVVDHTNQGFYRRSLIRVVDCVRRDYRPIDRRRIQSGEWVAEAVDAGVQRVATTVVRRSSRSKYSMSGPKDRSQPSPEDHLAHTHVQAVKAVDREDFILVVPFGKHAFANRNHVKNFLRYLFSLTQNHPTRNTTINNMVCEWDVTGTLTSSYMNASPQDLYDGYRKRNFDRISDPQVFMDDGAYVTFIVEADGKLFSNLVVGRRNGSAEFEFEFLPGSLSDAAEECVGGRDQLEDVFITAAGDSREILDFAEADIARREIIERKLHIAVNEVMGGRVALSVSHNDQPTHNPHYHVHRIRMWEEDEVATITQEQINERNRTKTPYDGDRLDEATA